jgi:hypothetical protein
MCKTSRTFVDYILHGCGKENNQWNHPKKLVLHKIEDVESFFRENCKCIIGDP